LTGVLVEKFKPFNYFLYGSIGPQPEQRDPHRRDCKFLGRWLGDVQETKNVKEMYEAHCQFPEG